MSRILDGAEQLLLSFGPFGVAVTDGPYGVFKWQWQNVFVIELTSLRLVARRTSRRRPLRWPRGGRPFEIPYAAVVSVRLLPHPARLGLMRVLEIVYRDSGGVHEKSIAAYNQPAEQAFAILQQFAPPGCC